VAAKNTLVPRCALRCKQSSALFLLRVVAKIISAYVMKLENSLAILFVSCLACSILTYNASHL
ncbi:MAG: hypothetical protein L0G93_11385, partial [Acinetobacter sp.]|nr:hypothetical protein [Acinetobacter sp.]